MNDTELEGRVAVVAGGSKGTGLATARRLRQAGAQVVTIARTAPEEGDALFVQGDLGTAEGVATAAAEVTARVGAPDVLVHIVGGSDSPAGGFAALDDPLWSRELALNLLSAVRLDRALLPAMVARGSGAVVEVRRWLDHVPPVEYDVREVTGTRAVCRAVAEVPGDFPGSPGTLRFTFDRDARGAITRLEITPDPARSAPGPAKHRPVPDRPARSTP